MVGRHLHRPDSDYDPEQLAKGIRIEFEHTDNEFEAREIAKDHISEIPDYYIRLEIMERDNFWSIIEGFRKKVWF